MSQCIKVLTDNFMGEIVQLYGIPVILCRTETRDSDCNLVRVFREI